MQEDWHPRALMMLSGFITLLLSILLGGFVKHLAGHQQDRSDIFTTLDKKWDKISETLEKMQTKEGCQLIHDSHVELIDTKLDSIEDKLSK